MENKWDEYRDCEKVGEQAGWDFIMTKQNCREKEKGDVGIPLYFMSVLLLIVFLLGQQLLTLFPLLPRDTKSMICLLNFYIC